MAVWPFVQHSAQVQHLWEQEFHVPSKGSYDEKTMYVLFGWKWGKWKAGDYLKMRGETGKSQFMEGSCIYKEVQILSTEWLGSWGNRFDDTSTHGWLLALRAIKILILITPLQGIYAKKIIQNIERGMCAKILTTLFTIRDTGRKPRRNT